MKGLTTIEAFEELISQPGYTRDKELKYARNNYYNKGVSIEKMQKVLENHGYKKVREELWRK